MSKIYMRLYKVTIVILLLGSLCGMQIEADEQAEGINTYLTPEWYLIALRDQELHNWESLFKRLTHDVQLWEKLSVAPYLIDMLLNEDVYKSEAADRLSGGHRQ
jgi:hypothetical protein